jgi:hypothetical protein
METTALVQAVVRPVAQAATSIPYECNQEVDDVKID